MTIEWFRPAESGEAETLDKVPVDAQIKKIDGFDYVGNCSVCGGPITSNDNTVSANEFPPNVWHSWCDIPHEEITINVPFFKGFKCVGHRAPLKGEYCIDMYTKLYKSDGDGGQYCLVYQRTTVSKI